MNKYDIIIIGAGAAGLSAAIFTARRDLSTLVVSKDLGGQLTLAEKVENYPGIKSVGGKELINTCYEQAKNFGAQFLFAQALHIEKIQEDGFVVSTTSGKKYADALILACGLTPRDLGVAGEDKLKGKGVVHDVVDKQDMFNGSIVVVVGGGSSAVSGVLQIAPLAQKVVLVHRNDRFSAEPILLEKMKRVSNMEVLVNSHIKEICGKDWVEKVVVETQEGVKEIECKAIYVAIGYEPNLDFVQGLGLIECDDQGEIVIDMDCKTSTDGVFAAGDITNISYKQMVISAGEGAKAALSAAKYVYEKQGKKLGPDWK